MINQQNYVRTLNGVKLVECFSNSDAILEGAHMTPENRYTYSIFIDNGLIYGEWGYKIFSLP